MNFYESIFICSPLLTEEETGQLVEKIRNFVLQEGGEISELKLWGKRRLAYPIKRQREGYYVFLEFSAPPALVKGLENLFRITDKIIRHLVVRKEKKLSPPIEKKEEKKEEVKADEPAHSGTE